MGYKNRRVKSVRMTDATTLKLKELAKYYEKNDFWFNLKMGYNNKRVTTADVIEHLVHDEYEKVILNNQEEK